VVCLGNSEPGLRHLFWPEWLGALHGHWMQHGCSFAEYRMPTTKEYLNMSLMRIAICLVCSVLPMTAAAADGEWTQFRGPGSRGHSDAVGLPVTWSEQENIRWKTAIPGEGHSSPVISGDQIWVSTAVSQPLLAEEEKERLSKIKNPRSLKLAGKLTLQALQLNRGTGKIEQQITLFTVENPEPKHALNSYASPTPVIVDDRIYFHFGTYGTACVQRESGDVVWRNTDLHVDHQNGPGSSPAVWEDKLIVHFDGTDQQFIAAFDCLTGAVVWNSKRSGVTNPAGEMKKAYGTPLIIETRERPLVVSPAADWVYGYDARNGKEIWKAAYGQLGFSTVPCPVVSGDTVYIATSFMKSRLLAVRYTGEGDVTDSHVRWISDKQIPKKPSMLLSGNRLFFVSDSGIVRCVDAASGDDIWFGRLSGEYSASPLLAAGRLYFFNQTGVTTVIEDSGDFREISMNLLEDGFMASPAVADNALFLRTTTHLYRVEKLD
jgi:outer membrane protein assembly factor BamB